MNIVSFISIVTAVFYFMLIFHTKKSSNLYIINVFCMLVCSCLGLWLLCDGFFFVAKTKEEAWFWHHLSSIGWCMYGGATSYYFLIMSDLYKKLHTLPRQIAYWSLPMILLVHNLFGSTTSLANDLVQSESGLGWTIQMKLSSFWTILYFIYLIVYIGGSLVYLLFWGRKEENKEEISVVNGFIILNMMAISLCLITYVLVPYFTSYLPPLVSTGAIVFIAGYWFVIREYDLLHVEFALNPKSIFETCLDAIIITSNSYLILYANEEAKRLLQVESARKLQFLNYFGEQEKEKLKEFAHSKERRLQSIDLRLENGTPLLCTISRSATLNKKASVIIFSLHDATQLKEAQERLDYLAHYDELTNLPNRRLLMLYLNEWEQKYKEQKLDFQLLFMDLNNFKSINDSYGHQMGDLVIKKVADSIKEVLGEKDIAARLSGDEFIVIHPIQKNDNKKKLLNMLHDHIATTKVTEISEDFNITTSIGYACYSETRSIRLLMKKADESMYENKRRK